MIGVTWEPSGNPDWVVYKAKRTMCGTGLHMHIRHAVTGRRFARTVYRLRNICRYNVDRCQWGAGALELWEQMAQAAQRGTHDHT
jgi:hypothetical protein